MRADNFSFKSFYYCLGTTSFRMSNFNLKIERQLALLDEFWKIGANANADWEKNEKIQSVYYDFLKENKFIEGDAPRKAKDARQKTSGLRDIGLIDDGRRLTSAGKTLLKISQNGDFSCDNFLQIPRDSFVYFKQLLKTSISINNSFIRPFVLLARLLKKFDFLTFDEFAYLFPLCIDEKTTNFVESELEKSRGIKAKIDEIIAKIFMSQENYKDALQYFLSEKEITAETFKKIGLNRKSRDYDAAYFPLWQALKKVYFDKATTEKNIWELYEKSDLQNVKTHWRKLLFKTSSCAAIKKSPFKHFQTANVFSNPNDEKSFKTAFFKTMHLIKIKRTLEDYFDLNRRYLKISDTLTFSDEQVRFDIIPKAYFSQVDKKFFDLAFKKSEILFEDKSLEEISPYLKFDEKNLLQKVNAESKSNFSQIGEVKNFVEGERLKRFNRLIDSKFSDEKIIQILQLFKARKDSEIQSLVTDNADAPTIFEYVLAIAWYKISERRGNVLSFMNLSLDADLLPKTHAGGGEADIVWKYSKTLDFPQHDLLIEATLSDAGNQRRMEMESVSRHLGEYLLANPNFETYCVFLTNYLNLNVISDFRMRKNQPYYSKDGENSISGMMIIPIETDILIETLKNKVNYSYLYKVFHDVYNDEVQPKEWYAKLSEKLRDQQ